MSLKQYNFQPTEPNWPLVRHHKYKTLKTKNESLLKEKEELAQNLATKEEEKATKEEENIKLQRQYDLSIKEKAELAQTLTKKEGEISELKVTYNSVILSMSDGKFSLDTIINIVRKEIKAEEKEKMQRIRAQEKEEAKLKEEERRKQLGFNEKNPWSKEKEEKKREKERKANDRWMYSPYNR